MAGPVLTLPAGTIGLPDGVKEAGRRVDFKPDAFTLAIETKSFGRIAWTQACYCPCLPNNNQTEQPDPNCSLCGGHGWLMFRPTLFVTDSNVVGDLNSLQTKLVADNNASIIMGIMHSFTANEEPYAPPRRRIPGTAMCTVRPENKLGYWDRLVNLDALIVYSQLATTVTGDYLSLTYPVVQMNLLRSADSVFEQGTSTDPKDFVLEDGQIKWTTPPGSGLRVAAHYLCHPTWRVIEHPHTTRVTPVKFKTKSAIGDQIPLPVQATIRYEFLLT